MSAHIPRGASFQSYQSVPGGQGMTPNASSSGLVDQTEKSTSGAAAASTSSGLSKKAIIGIVLGVLIVAGVATGIGVGVSMNKNNDSSNAASSGGENGGGKSGGGGGSSGGGGGSSGGSCGNGPFTGQDGSTITMENGTTFVYRNSFGGNWTAIPFDDSARPQADVPILSQPWDFENMRIHGVNLGGWLVLEPFISPEMFEPYLTRTNPQVVDEWTLSQQLLIDDSTGKKRDEILEAHYASFITEEDFAQVAAAGLNWVRLAVPFWMIEKYPGEPYVTASITYKWFLKSLSYARKYGIRVSLDLHSVPGSANGWNHGGRLANGVGAINFMNGPMGIANAERATSYILQLTRLISEPAYKNVVPMFGVVNEPFAQTIGTAQLRSFYTMLYQNIRAITGYGQGNGPVILFHDGFLGFEQWNGLLPGADRVAMDQHPYFAFNQQTNDPMPTNAMKPCNMWGANFNNSQATRGIVVGGEYSAAINDCSYWLNNIGYGIRFEGTWPDGTLNAAQRVGSCDVFNNYPAWTADFKTGISNLIATSQDAMFNSFFWTWRIGPSTAAVNNGITPNPFWSYTLGLAGGWIDPNPRNSIGACARVAGQYNLPAAAGAAFNAFPSAAATGGAGANAGVAAAFLNANPWPPAMSNAAGLAAGGYPRYTQTGSAFSLAQETACQPSGTSINTASLFAVPTPTATPAAFAAQVSGIFVPISGCTYPDTWTPAANPIPQPVCGAGAGAAAAAAAAPEPAADAADRAKRDALGIRPTSAPVARSFKA